MSNNVDLRLEQSLYDELMKIMKLYRHARSAKKLGNKEEASSFFLKGDELAKKWARRLRDKSHGDV